MFRGVDGHIHELWWQPTGWHYADLSSLTGVTAAASDPAAYVFKALGQQHVMFRGSDGHIHELWWG